jgi:hypothetical protein
MAYRRETREERQLRQIMVHNTSQRLASVVGRLNEIEDIRTERYRRVHREMMKAAEQVAKALHEPISDGALRWFDGETAVKKRAAEARKLGLGKVVPIRRREGEE